MPHIHAILDQLVSDKPPHRVIAERGHKRGLHPQFTEACTNIRRRPAKIGPKIFAEFGLYPNRIGIEIHARAAKNHETAFCDPIV